MSFVTAQPEALMAAASQLQTLGSSMAAQNEAAAAPTTGVVPAAADEVSALQATQFAAYGTWYQQVSAQAAAIHQMLVNTLGTSAGSYGEAEAANQAVTSATSSSGLSGILGAATTPAQPSGLPSSFGATFGTPLNWFQNFAAASSDMFDLAQGQFIPTSSSSSSAAFGLASDVSATLPAGAAGPVGPAGFGGVPVSAGLGQASSVGGLSVPPSWAADGVPAVSSTPATLPGAGWTSAAPHGAPVTTMPAGMPSVASAGRGGFGLGAPRYGVKPTVMAKPAVVLDIRGPTGPTEHKRNQSIN